MIALLWPRTAQKTWPPHSDMLAHREDHQYLALYDDKNLRRSSRHRFFTMANRGIFIESRTVPPSLWREPNVHGTSDDLSTILSLYLASSALSTRNEKHVQRGYQWLLDLLYTISEKQALARLKAILIGFEPGKKLGLLDTLV